MDHVKKNTSSDRRCCSVSTAEAAIRGHVRHSLAGLVIFLSCLAGANAVVAQQKAPVPEAKSQETSRTTAREIYREAFQQAKTAAEKMDVARKMCKAALGIPNGTADQYVLLTIARDIAAGVGDVTAALQAVEILGGRFDVPLARLKGETLLATARQATTADQCRAVAEAARLVVDSLAIAGEYDLALDLCDRARLCAENAQAKALGDQLLAKSERLKREQTDVQNYQDAIQRLRSDPSEPSSNLAAGRYLCFVKGDWERGIPMLALGSDTGLRAVASQELQTASSPDGQVSVGDAWWGLAEKEIGEAKERIQQRAAHWYRKALPNLSGLAKIKAEKRLAETASRRGASNVAVIDGQNGLDVRLCVLNTCLAPAGGSAMVMNVEVQITNLASNDPLEFSGWSADKQPQPESRAAMEDESGAILLAVPTGSGRISPRGYSPESPEVQQMLDQAIAYLEENGRTTYGVGADCLIASALVKAGENRSHPLVQEAIANSRTLAQTVAKQGLPNYLYNEAIACVFLCDMDPKAYASEISLLLQAMPKRQRPNGAFSYDPYTYDDTSQTQYGVLCYWAAHQAGIQVPPKAVEAAVLWLIRTQNIDGGWVYQAQDPGRYERRNQGPTTHSMSAAALSSVYICAHLFGFGADAKNAANKVAKSKLPPAVQKIETEASKRRRQVYLPATTTNAQQVAATTALGNAWFVKNLTYEVPQWTHYYMYAVERYKSFQELVEGKVVPEPAWYNDGVEYLKKTQLSDGSWNSTGSHAAGPPVHTAFAMLFLTRSSQKSIKKVVPVENRSEGGMGFLEELTNARIQDGKVIRPGMVRIAPGESVIETLSFAIPDNSPKPFRLKLPLIALGRTGDLGFEIPREMIVEHASGSQGR